MINKLSLNLSELALRLPADIPKPGKPTAPPGSDKFDDIMGWFAWGCLAVCILALMGAGAMMAISSRRGEGSEHAGRIGAVLVGVMVISGAGSIVSFIAS